MVLLPHPYPLISLVVVGVRFLATSSLAQSCDLACPLDAPCTFGSVDYSNHQSVIDQWHSESQSQLPNNINGMHCACPSGWTGVQCDHVFETCSFENSDGVGDSGHKCYHGGACIPGLQDDYENDQLFCDCTLATSSTDGNGTTTRYTGKYCETPVWDNSYCNTNEIGQVQDDNHFCVHDSTCNPLFPYVYILFLFLLYYNKHTLLTPPLSYSCYYLLFIIIIFVVSRDHLVCARTDTTAPIANSKRVKSLRVPSTVIRGHVSWGYVRRKKQPPWNMSGPPPKLVNICNARVPLDMEDRRVFPPSPRNNVESTTTNIVIMGEPVSTTTTVAMHRPPAIVPLLPMVPPYMPERIVNMRRRIFVCWRHKTTKKISFVSMEGHANLIYLCWNATVLWNLQD
jgi:hypothetical protein